MLAVAKAVQWSPPPLTAREMVEPQGFAIVRSGTVVKPADLGVRVFSDGRHGYALALINFETFPAMTSDGGRTWTVDGPLFHAPAAQGAVAVGAIGVSNARTAFAWGGTVPNTVVDVTTDGGRHWWQAFLPGSVLFVGDNGGELIANIYGSVRDGRTTHTGLWEYRSTTGRRWTYSYSLT